MELTLEETFKYTVNKVKSKMVLLSYARFTLDPEAWQKNAKKCGFFRKHNQN